VCVCASCMCLCFSNRHFRSVFFLNMIFEPRFYHHNQAQGFEDPNGIDVRIEPK
jgi:hypothetical protein